MSLKVLWPQEREYPNQAHGIGSCASRYQGGVLADLSNMHQYVFSHRFQGPETYVFCAIKAIVYATNKCLFTVDGYMGSFDLWT